MVFLTLRLTCSPRLVLRGQHMFNCQSLRVMAFIMYGSKCSPIDKYEAGSNMRDIRWLDGLDILAIHSYLAHLRFPKMPCLPSSFCIHDDLKCKFEKSA